MYDFEFQSVLSSLYNKYTDTASLLDELQRRYPNLTREAIRCRVKRYRNNLKNKNNISADDGFNRINIVKKDNDNFNAPITKSVEYKSDGSAIFDRIIALKDGEQLTPDNVLEAHGMDKRLWELISCKSNFYQQQKKGGTVLNLYQSKITAKPLLDKITFDDIKDYFDTMTVRNEPPCHYTPSDEACYLYEINIADLHLGRFCQIAETNGDLYNVKIAKERFIEIIESEINNIRKFDGKVEKILFVWSNDFFNSDGINKATTGGTPQDTSTKWQQLFLDGLNMLIEAINMLSVYAPVKTFYVASNHSRQVDYYALCALYAWFRSYDNVEVVINQSPRYYERYGVNLIGFAHSYYEKKQNLPHLMQIEQPAHWGVTKYREYHLAHYHSEKVEEIGGIIFRWLPSVTGPDTWSNDCGYIGAVKRSYSFVYHKDRGLVQMNSTVIE